jgi:predicted type IV restriction endonuclease
VDTAGNTFEEGHDPDAIAPGSKKCEGRADVRLLKDTANQMSAAMNAIASVASPHYALTTIHLSLCFPDGVD